MRSTLSRIAARPRLRRLLPLLAVAGLIPAADLAHATTLDLRTAVDRALLAEAKYRAARAEYAAMQQEIPRARAGLLPQLSASGSRTDNRADITQTNALGQKTSRDSDYVSSNYSVTLRQPLVRYDSWIKYRQADTRVEHAGRQVELAHDSLILSVGESYLNCLLADAVAQFARAEVSALEGLLESATRGLSAGTATRTDVLDAEARLDSARVKLIEARHGIDAARRTLEAAVGEPIDAIRAIDADRLVLGSLSGRIDDWREAALAGNPEIAAARLAVDLARDETRLQRAGHYPTLDFIAQRQLAESDSISTLGTRTHTNLWGFQANIPLFAGGYVTASTRQAAARLERAQAELDATVEQITLRSARAVEGIKAASQRVQALARAEDSAAAALVGTKKGLRAGTRSFIDVLNARQQLFEARQNRARANAEFVLGLLELKAAAGELDDAAIAAANSFLAADVAIDLNSD